MMRFFSIFKNRIKMRFISTQCNSPRIPMPTANYLLSSKLALHFNSVVHIVYSLASNLANLVTLYFLCALVPALNSALVSLDPPEDAQKPSSGTEPDKYSSCKINHGTKPPTEYLHQCPIESLVTPFYQQYILFFLRKNG